VIEMLKVEWDAEMGCSGPEISGKNLAAIKAKLDELYGYDVGRIEMGSGGPAGAQSPEWIIRNEGASEPRREVRRDERIHDGRGMGPGTGQVDERLGG